MRGSGVCGNALRTFVLVVASVFAVATPAAHAANVSVTAGTLSYAAVAGETNSVSISLVGNDYLVDDSLTPTVGASCTLEPGDDTNATCLGAGVTRVSATLLDLDDTFQVVGQTGATVLGGDGADTLSGDAGDDAISGEDGDDVLIGGDGADQLNGGNGVDWVDYSGRATALTIDLLDAGPDGGVEDGAGDDISDAENVRGGDGADIIKGNNLDNIIDGGAAADAIDGDSGIDIVDYSSRSTPVTIDLADALPDGGLEDGTGDTYTSIEGATGGLADDTLLGDTAPNTLSGGGGNDLLNGRTGPDYLVGGTGTDTVDYSDRTAPVTADLDGAADDGEASEGDRIETDVESLVGGSGPDVLTGNNGDNTLNGGPGDDTLDGALGADDLTGGDGIDSVSYVMRTDDLDISVDDVATSASTTLQTTARMRRTTTFARTSRTSAAAPATMCLSAPPRLTSSLVARATTCSTVAWGPTSSAGGSALTRSTTRRGRSGSPSISTGLRTTANRARATT